MKVYYVLDLSHKTFEEISDVFVFNDLDVFCYFSEIFHLKEDWTVGYNTNTKNPDEYVSVLNTDTSRMLIDNEKGFFDSVEEVDKYYRIHNSDYKVTVESFLKSVDEKSFNNEIEKEFNTNDPHKIYFADGSLKTFHEFENLDKFLTAFKNKNIDLSLIKLQINPDKILFSDYINLILSFDPDMYIPEKIINSELLNLYLLALEDMYIINEYIEEKNNLKNKKSKKDRKKRT